MTHSTNETNETKKNHPSDGSDSDSPRCSALRKDGNPCTARTHGHPSGLCVGHRPEAMEARTRGGYNRRNSTRVLRMLPARLRPVADMLSAAMTATRDGQMEPRVATALAALAGALVRVVTAGELEDRVRALEAATNEAEQDGAA